MDLLGQKLQTTAIIGKLSESDRRDISCCDCEWADSDHPYCSYPEQSIVLTEDQVKEGKRAIDCPGLTLPSNFLND